MYPDVPAVFVNTGLEYPEIQAFVKEHENVTILRPKMRFDEVLKTYGYPVLSKEIAKKLEAVRLGRIGLNHMLKERLKRKPANIVITTLINMLLFCKWIGV